MSDAEKLQTLMNGLKAIANMNEKNRDLMDAKVMARRTLRDARLSDEKVEE